MAGRRIGEYLIEKKHCRPEQIDRALEEQLDLARQEAYKPLGLILLERGQLRDGDLNEALQWQRLEVMAAASLFKNLPKRSLHRLAKVGKQETYPEETLIFRQDEPGDTFCVIISGRVKVFRTLEGGVKMTLATLGPGEGFGEMALLAGEPRSASVETIEPSSLLIIPRQSFLSLCRDNTDVPLAFIKVLCDRLARGNVHLELVSEEELAVRKLFGKYVTPEVRDEIISGRLPLDGENKEVTVLFADLRNFTPLVESTPPKEMVRILNGYFTEMAVAIRHNNGLVLQYIGDEIEAVFGAPLAVDDHPRLAVQAALEMRRRLAELNREASRCGPSPLAHGIGIHTGEVVAANIGSPDRMSYALVGDTVNVASRLQDLNKKFGTDIIVSKTTRDSIAADFAFKKLPPASLKGKSGLMDIYTVE